MADGLLDRWLAHYDSIHRGWTPRGIANGVCATNGFAFPRLAGGYNLYRGVGALENVDTDVPVGAAGANASQLETFSWRPAAASTTYVHVIRSIGGGGVESPSGAQAVTVSFDAFGQPEGLKPNTPTSLAAAPQGGGRFEVSWRYVARDQETPPVEFRVYGDGGSGTVDFDSPLGAVPYRARRGQFRFITGEHAHGAVRSFAVRAVSEFGTTDGNTVVAGAWADAEGPPVHTSVFTETVDAE